MKSCSTIPNPPPQLSRSVVTSQTTYLKITKDSYTNLSEKKYNILEDPVVTPTTYKIRFRQDNHLATI